MWSSLEVNGYRAWSKLELRSLARVNILVGRNGAGKTTVLEAVEVLASRTLAGLIASSTRREETVYVQSPNGYVAATSFASIFHGRRAQVGQKFSVNARSTVGSTSAVSVDLMAPQPQPQLLPDLFDASIGSVAIARWSPDGPTVNVGLSADGVARSQSVNGVWTTTAPFRYVTSRSLSPQGAAQIFAPLAGTPREDRVVQALQIVGPNVERVVVGSSGPPILALFARLSGIDDRVPFGSLGDGATRMLVLASELTNASGGVLLVDEIESGLHVSVMAAMWRMLIQTAAEADVQIFATTHSDDCLRGLASLCAAEPDGAFGDEVCVYRLDRGVEQATRYAAGEVELALTSGMEIRG